MTPTLDEAAARKLIVDEFGILQAERARMAPHEKRYEFLTDEIRSWYPDLAADATAIAAGDIYAVHVQERKIEKSWRSITAVCKAVGGAKVFQSLAELTFKACAGVIGNTKAEALQTEARTGNRKLVASPIPLVIEKAVELDKAA